MQVAYRLLTVRRTLKITGILQLIIRRELYMTDTDTRREEYISLFKTYEMDVDWNFLPGDYIDMPEYKWRGFLHSINMILSQKLSARNKKQ